MWDLIVSVPDHCLSFYFARVQWARRHIIWRRADWNNVLFNDESRFPLSRADGRTWVYRRINERYADCCLMERDQFSRGSLMVWDGIMGRRKTRRYIDDVLRPHDIPFLRNQGPGVTSQHDIARPQTVLITRQNPAQNFVDVLLWPAVYPDLYPI